MEDLIVVSLTKINLKGSGECLAVCGCSGYIWMGEQWNNLFRDIVVILLEWFVCWLEVVFRNRLAIRASGGIPQFLKLN